MRVIPGLKAGVTIAEACQIMAQAFAACGIENALTDARILAAHALSLSRAQLLSQSDRELEPREVDALSARAARRLRREPVSRILGAREFWGLKLAVNESVLDPRPETETLVEAALDWITTRGLRQENLRVLDIGTGSGALLLALLSELPNATGIATDISVAALATARDNAQHHNLSARCYFIACNVAAALRGPFDLIVANPPYISTAGIEELAPEVRDYDPRAALDGGPDGLSAYRAIAAEAGRLLGKNGRLIVELGQGQADEVHTLFMQAGLAAEHEPRRDLAGIGRALSAIAP